jgi:hypothetical protein
MDIRFINFQKDLQDLIYPARWKEIGLYPYHYKKFKDSYGNTIGQWTYKVMDKNLFFLAVIKYGIEFEEVKCSM